MNSRLFASALSSPCSPAAEGSLHLADLIQVDAGRLVFQEPVEFFYGLVSAAGFIMQDGPQTALPDELGVDDEHRFNIAQHRFLIRFFLGQTEEVAEHAEQDLP